MISKQDRRRLRKQAEGVAVYITARRESLAWLFVSLDEAVRLLRDLRGESPGLPCPRSLYQMDDEITRFLEEVDGDR